MGALVKRGDKTALQKLYNDNKGNLVVTEEQTIYTSASYGVFLAKMGDAATILDKEEAITSEIDAAYTALDAAVKGLVKLGVKTELQTKLDVYSEIFETAQNNYNAETLQALNEAFLVAKSTLADSQATEADVASALAKLELAWKNRVEATETFYSVIDGGNSALAIGIAVGAGILVLGLGLISGTFIPKKKQK